MGSVQWELFLFNRKLFIFTYYMSYSLAASEIKYNTSLYIVLLLLTIRDSHSNNKLSQYRTIKRLDNNVNKRWWHRS